MPTCDALLARISCAGTSYREAGKRVTVQPAAGEDIRFYRTDSPAFRQAFALVDSPVSDLAVIYRTATIEKIIFVELKGTDLRRASTQIARTISAVRPCLRREFPDATLLGVASTSGSAPKMHNQAQREFKRDCGERLLIRTGPLLDLRAAGCLMGD